METRLKVDDFLHDNGGNIDELEAMAIPSAEAEVILDPRKHQTALRKWRDDNLVMTTLDPAGKWFYKPAGKFITHEDLASLHDDKGAVYLGEKPMAAGVAIRKLSDAPKVDCIGYETKEAPQANFSENGISYFNAFAGIGVEPKEGDTGPFDELLDSAVSRETNAVELRKWIEQAFAYPIQNLGKRETKMPYALVFQSKTQGSGKSLIGHAVGSAYGGLKGLFKEVDQKGLHDSFIDDWAKSLFILADEISLNDRRADQDFLKNLISRRSVRVNGKCQPAYSINDHINWVITSNHEDAVFLESENDRRYAIFNMDGKLNKRAKAIYEWTLDPQTGPAMLWRLQRVDLSGFDTSDDAPMTGARQRMFEAGLSELDAWARDVIASPEGILVSGTAESPDLWSLPDIAAVFEHTHNKMTSHKALSKSLEKAGVYRTQRIVTKRGNIYLYVVKNVDKWRRAKPGEIGDAYDKTLNAKKF